VRLRPCGDAYVATSLCDQRRRATELAARHSKKPVFMLHVPAACRAPGAEAMYIAELQRLGRFLVRLGGKEPSRDELILAMRRYSVARASLAATSATIPARQAAEAYWNLCENGPAGDAPPWLWAVQREGKPKPPGVPILLLGGPLTREGLVVLDCIEQAGGCVVVNATENGPATAAAPLPPVHTKASGAQFLMRTYYRHIPHPFSRPNDWLYEWLAATLTKCHARGILFIRHVWCDLWHAELARLKACSPVPVVDLDLAAGDDTAARVGGRVQALMEMLA
jgi:benzoyl-CoA reductase/2-hydroxyglutaryl-CoA dehydratase subunit BcrC/BadD/HgdB